MLDSIVQDLRFAIRGLRSRPGFTAVALVTLTLGIGANVAMFSVVDAVALRPLPYPSSERLVRVWPERRLTAEMFEGLSAHMTGYDALGVHARWSFKLSDDATPTIAEGAVASPGYLASLGAVPTLGRLFGASDPQHTVVLSHGLWQRRFGGDPSIVGRTLAIDGVDHEIVGVLERDYRPLVPGRELWTPLPFARDSEEYRDFAYLDLVGRLAEGHSLEAADLALRGALGILREAQPDRVAAESVAHAGVTPLLEFVVGSHRRSLLLLLGAVAAVLLVACVNVANLLLASGMGRRHELTLRRALGAGRRRIMRQLLTESLLLGVAGGVCGVVAAVWSLDALVAWLPADLPRTTDIAIDQRLLVYALFVSLVAAIAFGLVPALRTSQPDCPRGLAVRSGGGRNVARIHSLLVGAEVAIAVVLVAGSALLVKSLVNLQSVELGFDPRPVWTFRIVPPSDLEGDIALDGYYQDTLDTIRSIPATRAAGVINRVPLTPGNYAVDYSTADHPPPTDGPAPMVSVRLVAGDWQGALGIPLLSGRSLGAEDRSGAAPVGLINRTFARQLWPQDDPVGREIRFGDGSPWFTVVGVVGDMRRERLDRVDGALVYLPFAQNTWETSLHAVIAARPGIAPNQLASEVRTAVHAVDSGAIVLGERTLTSIVRSAAGEPRFLTLLVSSFAGLVLMLGAVGVYGVTAYSIRSRVREIGIRLALGATSGGVLREVMRRATAPIGVGLLVGGTASFAVGRLLEANLFEVSSMDPSAMFVAIVTLGAVAGFAAFIASRAVTRVDPQTSLRVE